MTLKGWRVVKPQHNQLLKIGLFSCVSHESHCGMTICYVSGIKLFITGILHAAYFANFFFLYIPLHTIVVGYYGFTLAIRVSVCQ